MVKRGGPADAAGRGGTRARMVAGAVELLREGGVPGTTIDAVLERTGAPRGSVYHHFPGGRAELVTDAVRSAGEQIGAVIADGEDPVVVLERLARFWRRVLKESGYGATCPVVALAVAGAGQVPGAAAVVHEVLDGWRSAYAGVLRRHGHEPARARRLASLTVAAIEGAVVLCRADASTRPLDDAVAELSLLVAGSGATRA